jgi:hypothetical protein
MALVLFLRLTALHLPGLQKPRKGYYYQEKKFARSLNTGQYSKKKIRSVMMNYI